MCLHNLEKISTFVGKRFLAIRTLLTVPEHWPTKTKPQGQSHCPGIYTPWFLRKSTRADTTSRRYHHWKGSDSGHEQRAFCGSRNFVSAWWYRLVSAFMQPCLVSHSMGQVYINQDWLQLLPHLLRFYQMIYRACSGQTSAWLGVRPSSPVSMRGCKSTNLV